MTIQDKVADCLVRAGSTFRKDQKEEFFDMMNKELEGKLVLD